VDDQGLKRKPLAILGLGNEFLSDDGVGIRVVRELRKRLLRDDAVLEELSVGGLPLLEYIAGFEQCIIIDAVVTGKHPPGTAYRFVQGADPAPFSISSSHQLDLAQILSLAALMGWNLPRTLTVYGIEAADITTFRDACTEEVSRAIPLVVEAVCRELQIEGGNLRNHPGEGLILTEAIEARLRTEHV
jgi:hydrogenase maturation protease